MAESWNIKGDDRDEIIESAVNTAFGMSLMCPVTIGACVASTAKGSYFVAVEALNGDCALIECNDKSQAEAFMADIRKAVKEWPVPSRYPVRCR